MVVSLLASELRTIRVGVRNHNKTTTHIKPNAYQSTVTRTMTIVKRLCIRLQLTAITAIITAKSTVLITARHLFRAPDRSIWHRNPWIISSAGTVNERNNAKRNFTVPMQPRPVVMASRCTIPIIRIHRVVPPTIFATMAIILLRHIAVTAIIRRCRRLSGRIITLTTAATTATATERHQFLRTIHGRLARNVRPFYKVST